MHEVSSASCTIINNNLILSIYLYILCINSNSFYICLSLYIFIAKAWKKTYGQACQWRANLNANMIHGKNQFSKMSVQVATLLGYDNHKTNTGHGSRGLGTTLVAKSGCSLSTLKTFSRHANLKQTAEYAKGDEEDRLKASVAVQGIDVEEPKSKFHCCWISVHSNSDFVFIF